MALREWISDLNSAVTERDIVTLVAAVLKGVRRTSTLPPECLPSVPENAAEIRRAAAALTSCRFDSNTSNRDRDAYQQLLILFSLAVDRIGMLEARGLLLPIFRSGSAIARGPQVST